eukprot:scaffold12971_cov122-Skeletonema_dohrnii-CCMP3373.AAC.1
MSKNTTTSEPALCRFYFQNQQCRYGSSCRFSHEAPKEGMTRVEILSMIPCPYYARGVCSFGDDCELLHQQQQNHEGGGDAKDTEEFNLYNRKYNRKQKKVEEEEEVIDTTCGICLENVYNTQHKQFGLLSCCNHIFCHTCLMEWRCRSSEISSSSRRVCPTCREPSNYVIPSHTFPTNPSQKLDIVHNYKQKCSTIPCRKFVNGKLGSCPFGRDCFYAHQDESGVDVKDRDKTMQELFEERERHRNRNRRNNRESDLDMIAETLMMMALQRQFLRGERRPRRGQAVDDDDDDDDASFGIDDMLLELLSMGNSGDEDGLPLPMHQLFAAMGAFDDDENDSFNDGSDDDNSMPPLEDLDDNSMPPLEDLDDNSMPPLEDIE